MNIDHHSLPVLLLAALLSACGSTTTHHVLTGVQGPPHGGDVLIVLQGQTPPPGGQEVGVVQAIGRGTHADLAHVVDGLKQEAARLGCTAVINVKVDQGASTASGTGVCMRP